MVMPETQQSYELSQAIGVTARIETHDILEANFLDKDGPFGSVTFRLMITGKVLGVARIQGVGSWENLFTFESVEEFTQPNRSSRNSRVELRPLSFHIGMRDVRVIKKMMSNDFDPGSFFGVPLMPVGSVVTWAGGESTQKVRFIFTRLEKDTWKREVQLFGRTVTDKTSRLLAGILDRLYPELPGASSG